MILNMFDNNKGSMEVSNYIFNFTYKHLPEYPNKIFIFLDEDLEYPILQIVSLEKKIRDLDFSEIELTISKKNKKTFNFLLESTYLIESSSRQSITFYKSLTQKKSIRLSLTEHCNYRCFFCHEEGMDMNSKRNSKSYQEMCDLLLKMKELNYQDLTFTGGEPLVAKKDLVNYMDFMEKNNYLPDLTIVTNGYLIDNLLIERIKKYKGKFKFNFSMHSVDKESYFSIVNPINNDRDSFDKVVKNIKLIKENGIDLKMNFVILKGINNSPDYIKKILDFAHTNGAFCVKFLELLITDKLTKHFDYFYSLDSVKKEFEHELTLENITYRREEYFYKDSLLVEFQKCTCANGCSLCPLNREINITPQMNYHPCFILSKKQIDINSENIESSLKEGEIVIEQLIKKYGNESPIIIKNVKNENKKLEFVYTSPLSYEKLENILLTNNFKLDRQRAFEDYIYTNSFDNSFKNYHKIIKLTKNTYEGHYREVVQSRSFNTSLNASEVEFITSGKTIENKSEYDLFLNHLGFNNSLILQWNVKFFKRGELFISIGSCNTSSAPYIISTKRLPSDIETLLELRFLTTDIYLNL